MVRLSFILIVIVFVVVARAENYQERQQKIIDERIKCERDEITYNLKVAEEEYKSLSLRLQQVAAMQKKLQIYEKSALMMKRYCLWYDTECKLLYDKTVVYLDDEQVRAEQEFSSLKRSQQQSQQVLMHLRQRIMRLEQGLAATNDDVPLKKEKSPLHPAEKIDPALQAYFTCDAVKGWNVRRGVFLSSNNSFMLPIASYVQDVYKENNSYFIALRVGNAVLHFAYTGDTYIQKGDAIPPNMPLFSSAADNPIKKDTVLLFAIQHGNLIDISDICK